MVWRITSQFLKWPVEANNFQPHTKHSTAKPLLSQIKMNISAVFYQFFQLSNNIKLEKRRKKRRGKRNAGCVVPSQRFLGSGSSVSPPFFAAFAGGHHSSWTVACSSQTWASSGSLPLAPASTRQRQETGRGNSVISSLAFE